jgi:DNA adenine methylase
MNTTGYSDGLNHDEFWQWCRERVYEGHKVYVSEYQAPDDFIKVWEKPMLNCMNPDKKATERLFIYEGQF